MTNTNQNVRIDTPESVVPAPAISTSRFASVFHALSERRAARAADRALIAELAQYSTPSDLHELYAVLDRSEAGAPDEVAKLRRLVDQIHPVAA